MKSSRVRLIGAIILPLLLLAAGSAVTWIMPEQPIAIGLMILAVLSSALLSNRYVTLMVATLASISLGLPYAAKLTMPGYAELLWIGSLWTTVLMMAWDPKNRALAVEELRNTLAQAPTGLLITDLNGTIVSANEKMASILRHPQDELQGCALNDLVDTTLWNLLREHSAELAAGRALDIEFEVIDDAAQANTLYGHGKLACDASGRPRYYIIQVSDLTGEHLAKSALDAASQQMRRILANTSDMVLMISPKLHVTFANTTAVDALERDFGNVVGQPVYNCIKTSDRRAFMKALEEFTRNRRMETSIPQIHLQGSANTQVAMTILRLSDNYTSGYAIVMRTSKEHLQNIARDKKSQARFSQVFHNSPDAILILRASDEMVLDFNQGFTRLLGYQREAAIGEPVMNLNFWKNTAERDAVVERLRADNEVIDYETTLSHTQGTLVHVEISLRYIEIDNELCVLCIGRDITKRISAEAALVESEEKFEKIFTRSPDGIIILRQSDGVITDANDVTLQRSGYHRDEVIGKSVLQTPIFVAPDDLAGAAEELAHSGTITNREVSLTTKDGDTIPCLVSATSLELSGEAYVMAISKDISNQRAAEERLRGSEERFRGIFENAPIGIMLIDMQGHIFQANHMAASLLAYEEQHMCGIHISRLVPPEERAAFKESLAAMVHRQTTHKSERRVVCQNGLEMWTNFHVVLQRSRKGDPLYYIVQIADISDIKQGQQRMEQMAFYDTLTNLANRRLFQDRLNQAIEHSLRTNRASALLFLDLDNFKRVNDTLGHQVGDNLLREVAVRLQHCVRNEDTVARTGGDEFTILLTEIGTPSDAGLVAQKILNHLREPITISNHPLIVTTSIGITVVPGDGLDPNLLLRNADLAMYKAKEHGRNNYQFYSEDFNTNAVKRLRTEYEIRQALEKDEFELYYQPKVSIKRGKIVGVESLIRWNHPERGVLMPDEFITIAEDTGAIIDIGSWIIEAACRAGQQLAARHGEPIQVAINISPRQFRDPNLITTIRRSLRETGLAAEHLELEITETMLMQDVAAAEATVERLADLGVNLAIDDFGTGYSSLNYLKRFPINTVKVDRSFVTDIPTNPDDMAITRAVIAMAHQLKMEVVAEGVENMEQYNFLSEHHCEYAQGWLFSKAVPLEQVHLLLQQNSIIKRPQRSA